MMRALTRRETIAVLGSAAGAVMVPTAWSAPRGLFLYDGALDPQGKIAASMTGDGWTLVPPGREIDSLLHRLMIDAEQPAAIAGLTSPATQFVVEHVAQRRGMRRVSSDGPVWVLAK